MIQEIEGCVHDAAPVGLDGRLHVLAVELDDRGGLALAGTPKSWPWWIDLVDGRLKSGGTIAR